VQSWNGHTDSYGVSILASFVSSSRYVISIWCPIFVVTRIRCLVPFILWVLSRMDTIMHSSIFMSLTHIFPQSSSNFRKFISYLTFESFWFRWQMFRGSIGMLRDMLTLIACIGKGFREFYGIHFVFITTRIHPSIRIMSLLRSESLDAVPLSLFPSILPLSDNLLR
jgi:hypothetical protein